MTSAIIPSFTITSRVLTGGKVRLDYPVLFETKGHTHSGGCIYPTAAVWGPQ